MVRLVQPTRLIAKKSWGKFQVGPFCEPSCSPLTGPDSPLSFITWTGQPLFEFLSVSKQSKFERGINLCWTFDTFEGGGCKIHGRTLATRDSRKFFVTALFSTRNCKANVFKVLDFWQIAFSTQTHNVQGEFQGTVFKKVHSLQISIK